VIPSIQFLSMKGRQAIISGAAFGIGKAMALRFAEAGADLVLVDLDHEGLQRVQSDLGQYQVNVKFSRVDLRDKDQIDALWDGLDPLPDILINNAGIYPMKDYLKVSPAFLTNIMALNLESVFWMGQHFIAKRLKLGGTIVNLASIEAILPFKADLAAYSMSKAGVIGLTRALARDYGRFKFRINGILPGAIRTPGTTRLIKQALRGVRLDLLQTGYDFQRRLALNRWGMPDEVARVALFLSSDLASYVQGAIIPVDGGFLSS
jgi:NAD(P)-dependent dehydrogenase (short-subunit alcohol dehydrogenase family)